MEEFRISTFISGLKEELKIMVTMFKPNTVLATFGLPKLQVEEVTRKYKGISGKPYHPALPNTAHNPKILAPTPLQRLPPPQFKIESRYPT